ncbi:hypothetical protein SUGI_1072030 [Cryptomeria japonica]|nr:hypothetical protein SUGI_1072030 [Cryptomeria japonica]
MRMLQGATLVLIFFLLMNTHESSASRLLLSDRRHEIDKANRFSGHHYKASEHTNKEVKCESMGGKETCEDEEFYHADYIYTTSKPGH